MENTDLIFAINAIVEVNENYLIVDNKKAAEELSQFYLDNGVNEGNGVITGPFIDIENQQHPNRKLWYVQK